MKKGKLFLALIMSICLSACSGKAVDASEISGSPKAVMESTMESLKELDFEGFNDHTDNYMSTQRNWLGIPVRREYKVFNELQQPGLKSGKKYKWNKELVEKIVENLSWEIGEIEEKGDEAKIDIILTNKDLTDVTGIYEINLLKGMLESEGTGMMHMIKELSSLANDKGDLCVIVDEMDQTCSIPVTVQAKKKDGKWIICLSNDFIEAFMGNIGGSLNNWEYSEEIEKQIDKLELELEQKLELEVWQKTDQIGENVERWVEGLFE